MRLRQASTNPVVFAELPRAQHAFDFYSSVRVHHTLLAAERFLTFVYETRDAAAPTDEP